MPIQTPNFKLRKPTTGDAYALALTGESFDRVDSLLTRGISGAPSPTAPGSPVAGRIYGVTTATGWADTNAIAYGLAYRTLGNTWEYWLPTSTLVLFDQAVTGRIWVLNPGVSWTSYTITGKPAPRELTTSYTLQATDVNTTLLCTSSSLLTVTVPQDSSVNLPIGTVITGYQMGSAQVEIVGEVPSGNPNVRSLGGLIRSSGQYARFEIEKIRANEWVLSGDLSA